MSKSYYWIGCSALIVVVWTGQAPAQEATAELPGEMVVLPGGVLDQGSPEDEPGRSDNEGPQRAVRLESFALGKFEVTVAEFRSFVEHTGYRTDAERDAPAGGQPAQGCFSPGWVEGRSWRNPGFPQGDNHPVVCVSWDDATAYVEWLRRETGLDYRLPTESEFEYAHRAGSVAPRPWGDESVSCQHANQADASLKEPYRSHATYLSGCNDGYEFTAAVGSYDANAFGLHDIAGNVSEWTRDCWHANYDGAPRDGRSWESTSETGCSWRVLRGGDFVTAGPKLRSAHRTSIPPEFRTYHVGFRVALDPSSLD